MDPIELALTIALDAHRGQKRLDGQPYILHPLRMLLRAKTTDEAIVSLLHDVIEDSPVTLEQIADLGFEGTVLTALQAITHRAGEPYEDYVERVSSDRLATSVKILDLEDNLDVREWPDGDRYLRKVKRYFAAYRFLRERCAKASDDSPTVGME